MRVLTFLHSFEPGGVERVALRLVRHWRSLGVDAPLFVGRELGALRAELASDLDYAAPPRPRFAVARWETLWMILKLPAEIRRVRPDILFVAGSTYTIVAVAMRLLLGRRCPPVVAKLSNDLARADLPRIARLGWRSWLAAQARAARIWVVMDAAIAAEVAHGMATRCRVIHDPAIAEAQIRRKTRAGRFEGTRRFVAVGRLVPQKDFALMLEAFALAPDLDAMLTIIGDGPEHNALVAQAASLGLTGRVTFAGHIPDAASLLPAFDILVLSSRYEGVPAVIIEALAAGLGVIATDCGSGVRGLLDEGRFGWIVPRDPRSLAAALRDCAEWLPQGEGVADHVRRYTIERSAALYLEAFEDAAGIAASSHLATTPEADPCHIRQ